MKTIGSIILTIFFIGNLATAQDTMYVYRAGSVLSKQAVAEIDSIIFYKALASATVADIDGNVYHIVTIGSQTWMVENLKTTKFNDGTSIPLVSDSTAWSALSTPGFCFYNNDVATKNILYNWYTVNTDKLAPIGWHVPTNTEWSTLEKYLISNGYNYDGTTTANKIAKSLAATFGWKSASGAGAIGNDLTKNNTSGFSALPGGFRKSNGTFDGIGSDGDWWSSTPGQFDDAWLRGLNYGCNYVYGDDDSDQCGFSVRCIRDY